MDMNAFIQETKLRDEYIEKFKCCAYLDTDGLPNLYVERIWNIIDELDDKMKNRLLFWFATQHLTLINAR
ncbi:hypothetical protein [Paenibacillus medicaginis]|uniref:Uncharacterized protein n=1 Tax=Paenibacillus medicaginis TaxID=1470560 RepID=A0ABV5BUI5_9BACL